MSKDFQNVRMACRENPSDAMLVEQGDGMPDKLFFDINDESVYLNAVQVGELVRRMTAWIAGQSDEANLWEDV